MLNRWLEFSRILCRAEAGQELLEGSVWVRAYHIWLTHDHCSSATQSALINAIPKMEAELPISRCSLSVHGYRAWDMTSVFYPYCELPIVTFHWERKMWKCEQGGTVVSQQIWYIWSKLRNAYMYVHVDACAHTLLAYVCIIQSVVCTVCVCGHGCFAFVIRGFFPLCKLLMCVCRGLVITASLYFVWERYSHTHLFAYMIQQVCTRHGAHQHSMVSKHLV